MSSGPIVCFSENPLGSLLDFSMQWHPFVAIIRRQQRRRQRGRSRHPGGATTMGAVPKVTPSPALS